MPAGSAVITRIDDSDSAALVEAAGLTQASAISEPNGTPYFVVLRR
jgi:hypothetical protein